MELALLVWGISMLDGVIGMLLVIGALSIVICIIYFISKTEYPTTPILYRWPILYVCISLISFLIANAIPSEKTAYIMIAAYATQKIAQEPATEEISKKVLTIINQKLDGYIENPNAK